MPKEHSGGPPSIGLVWYRDKPVPVPIHHFPYDDLDRCEDYIAEEFGRRKTLDFDGFLQWLNRFTADRIAAEVRAAQCETINRLLHLIINSPKPKRRAVGIAIAAGTIIGLSKTIPEWAAELGIKKQAVQQCVVLMQKELGLPKVSFQRDTLARQKMSRRNFRRTKL